MTTTAPATVNLATEQSATTRSPAHFPANGIMQNLRDRLILPSRPNTAPVNPVYLGCECLEAAAAELSKSGVATALYDCNPGLADLQLMTNVYRRNVKGFNQTSLIVLAYSTMCESLMDEQKRVRTRTFDTRCGQAAELLCQAIIADTDGDLMILTERGYTGADGAHSSVVFGAVKPMVYHKI